MSESDWEHMPPLPGKTREMILGMLDTIREKLDWIEDKLCVEDESEDGNE